MLRSYATAYVALLAALAIVAALVGLVHPFGQLARQVLPFKWGAPHDPDAHDLATAASLWFHNSKLMVTPLALAGAVQYRPGRFRAGLDALFAMLLAVNVIPVAVDLGTWGSRLLPYIPNAPLELLATTVAFSSWWLVTRGRMAPVWLWAVLGAAVVLMGAAACLETWAVP